MASFLLFAPRAWHDQPTLQNSSSDRHETVSQMSLGKFSSQCWRRQLKTADQIRERLLEEGANIKEALTLIRQSLACARRLHPTYMTPKPAWDRHRDAEIYCHNLSVQAEGRGIKSRGCRFFKKSTHPRSRPHYAWCFLSSWRSQPCVGNASLFTPVMVVSFRNNNLCWHWRKEWNRRHRKATTCHGFIWKVRTAIMLYCIYFFFVDIFPKSSKPILGSTKSMLVDFTKLWNRKTLRLTTIGTRKQNVSDAETLLSHSVADFFKKKNYINEERYVRTVALWHEASD